MKFFTRANIAVPRTLEKRFPASFSKASGKRKKESSKRGKNTHRNYHRNETVRYENFGGASIYIYIYISA